MHNRSTSNIVTESSHEDNGALRIWSTIQLQDDSAIIIESLWKPYQDPLRVERKELTVRIGDLSVSVPQAPTPKIHSHMARELLLNSKPDVTDHDDVMTTNKRTRRVHLATRHDGVDVFLDPLSATFWAGARSRVKEVSVDTAAFVLKADRDSVIQSAIAASKTSWEAIRTALSITSLAAHLDLQIRKTGLSPEELLAGLHAGTSKTQTSH